MNLGIIHRQEPEKEKDVSLIKGIIGGIALVVFVTACVFLFMWISTISNAAQQPSNDLADKLPCVVGGDNLVYHLRLETQGEGMDKRYLTACGNWIISDSGPGWIGTKAEAEKNGKDPCLLCRQILGKF